MSTEEKEVDPRAPTLRRTLQQVKHCIEEALAVIERNEAPTHAFGDVDQARELLLEHVLPEIHRRSVQWEKSYQELMKKR